MKEEEIVEKNIWIAEGIRIGRKQLAEEFLEAVKNMDVLKFKRKIQKEIDEK